MCKIVTNFLWILFNGIFHNLFRYLEEFVEREVYLEKDAFGFEEEFYKLFENSFTNSQER